MTDKYTEPDEREQRLPVWARSEMQGMRYEIRNLRNLLADKSKDESNVTLDDGVHLGQEIGLGMNPRINFYLTEGKHRSLDAIQIYIDQRGKLCVQTNGQLIILPQSGNSCRIKVDSRYEH